MMYLVFSFYLLLLLLWFGGIYYHAVIKELFYIMMFGKITMLASLSIVGTKAFPLRSANLRAFSNTALRMNLK